MYTEMLSSLHCFSRLLYLYVPQYVFIWFFTLVHIIHFTHSGVKVQGYLLPCTSNDDNDQCLDG